MKIENIFSKRHPKIDVPKQTVQNKHDLILTFKLKVIKEKKYY